MNEQDSLGIAEAAAYARVNVDTIRRKIKSGELRAHRDPSQSGKYLLASSDLDAWLKTYRPSVPRLDTAANSAGEADLTRTLRILQEWAQRAEEGRNDLAAKFELSVRREQENAQRLNDRLQTAMEEKARLQARFKEFIGRINDFVVFFNGEVAKAREGRISARSLRHFPYFTENDTGILTVQPAENDLPAKRPRLLARLFNL